MKRPPALRGMTIFVTIIFLVCIGIAKSFMWEESFEVVRGFGYAFAYTIIAIIFVNILDREDYGQKK